jgi:hypothetical protein
MQIEKKQDEEYWYNNICELKENSSTKDVLCIGASTQKGIYLFEINFNKTNIIEQKNFYEIEHLNYFNSLMKKNFFFICCKDKAILSNDIFSNIIQGQNNIIMYEFIKCGICINNEIIAFTSRSFIKIGNYWEDAQIYLK